MQFLIDEALQQKALEEFISEAQVNIHQLEKKRGRDVNEMKKERKRILRHAKRRENGEDSETESDEEEEEEEEGTGESTRVKEEMVAREDDKTDIEDEEEEEE